MVEKGMFRANHGFGAGFCGGRVFEKNVGMVTDRQAIHQSHLLPHNRADEFSPPSMDTQTVANRRPRMDETQPLKHTHTSTHAQTHTQACTDTHARTDITQEGSEPHPISFAWDFSC